MPMSIAEKETTGDALQRSHHPGRSHRGVHVRVMSDTWFSAAWQTQRWLGMRSLDPWCREASLTGL